MVEVMAVRAVRVVAVARVRARLCRSWVAEAVIAVTRGKRAMALVAGGVIAAGLTGSLVGCDTEQRPSTTEKRSSTTDPELAVAHVNVDGVTRTCVVYRSYQKGGLSCDWSNK
ncbi:Uncharacterised protein [Mycobacteroides abscessus subsp. abscessus]|nr:Uncharacterised protein [Mycobacteroides abscessus subsp. abscessus]SLC89491.1 Uncharacterised protein [Mycobacteroides abscessus subsp. abscessus]